MSGVSLSEHKRDTAIILAADFLRAVPPGERPKPLIPALREMFELSSIDAVAAIRESHRLGGAA